MLIGMSGGRHGDGRGSLSHFGYLRFFCMVSLVTFFCFCVGGARGDVYMVLVEGEPVVSYRGSVPGFVATDGFSQRSSSFSKEGVQAVQAYSTLLLSQQDSLLDSALGIGTYNKIYGYNHLVNGFAVDISPDQADVLSTMPGVKHMELDRRVETCTTHTPDYLGLVSGMWNAAGGVDNAGEDIIIGMVDTGINPTHPSFADSTTKPYGPLVQYLGTCEVADSFPAGSCNGKIIGAQHFAEAAKSAGAFNTSMDFDSPLDGDGHGTHTSSIAAGNNDVPVIVAGVDYGKASGMAPRARIAVYKALYRMFGGFNADVVAAIDKAVQDGVDILNLSLGPNSPPADTTITFLSVFDLACLAAVSAGVLVVQAAGNGGPYPQTTLSFSPWIVTVAAGVDDRTYPNYVDLGNNQKLMGEGLAPSTPGDQLIKMVLAQDAVVGPPNPIYDPSDCQDSSSFSQAMVSGNILICTYSFNFIYGGSTIKLVEETATNLTAAGFVMVVQSDTAGSRFDPIPITMPGIIITTQNNSQMLLDYYNSSTVRDVKGQAQSFGAVAKIGNGQTAVYSGTSPVVAVYSSRGPDIRDFSFNNADLLKPNILAPGTLIWGAWSPVGIDQQAFLGEEFALISGTSMATPHIAGVAAVLKQQNPTWGPAILNSALSTTASIFNPDGSPLQAQQLSFGGQSDNILGTPFDYGSGAVNATAALDPGIVFQAGYDDYIRFICATPGVSYDSVRNLTGSTCNSSAGYLPTDLNTPSITVAQLNGTRSFTRTVMSIFSGTETYTLSCQEPNGISVVIQPQSFPVSLDQVQSFTVTLTAKVSATQPTFGEIFFSGDKGHSGHIPISVIASQLS
ncbi:unnamed protein product [Calypogeia fissa]